MLTANHTVKIPVLEFHQVLDTTETAVAGSDNITQHQFQQVIAALSSKGFTSISLARYYSWRNNKTTLPTHPVILTFDDGNVSDRWAAEHMPGFQGVEDVPTDSHAISWSNLRKLYYINKWEIASHSVHHAYMGDGKKVSGKEREVRANNFYNTPVLLDQELKNSKTTLEQNIWDDSLGPNTNRKDANEENTGPTIQAFVVPENDVTVPELDYAAEDGYKMIFGITFTNLVRTSMTPTTLAARQAAYGYIGDTTPGTNGDGGSTGKTDTRDGRLVRTAISGSLDMDLLNEYLDFAKTGAFTAPSLSSLGIPAAYIAKDGTIMAGGHNVTFKNATTVSIDGVDTDISTLRAPYNFNRRTGTSTGINSAGSFTVNVTGVGAIGSLKTALDTQLYLEVGSKSYPISTFSPSTGNTTSVTLSSTTPLLTTLQPDSQNKNPVIYITDAQRNGSSWAYAPHAADRNRELVNQKINQISLVALSGGDGNDVLTNSTNFRSSLRGGAGNDTLFGGSSVDTLVGGDGADVFHSKGDHMIDILYHDASDNLDDTDKGPTVTDLLR